MNRTTKICLVLTAVAALAGSVWIAMRYCSTWPEAVGVVGSVASLVGLGYTIIQVWETKALMVATKTAADDAVSELRANQYRYLLLRGGSLLGETHTHIQSRNWKIAAVRLHDVGDQCSQLAHLWQQPDEQWRVLAEIARWWATQFNDGQNNRVLDYDVDKWSQFYGRLRDKFRLRI